MKNSLTRSIIFSFTAFFTLESTHAAVVQSALAPAKVGITVQQLMATTSSNVALPTIDNRPAGMATASKGIHLGTNTDLFSVSTDEYWVRYTLSPASNTTIKGWAWDDETLDYTPYTNTNVINGELWLSFNFSTQEFAAHNRSDNPYLFPFAQSSGAFSVLPFGPGNRFADGNSGEPYYQELPGENADLSDIGIFPCVECQHLTALNLSFLRLSGSTLITTNQGFDQILTSTSTYHPGYGGGPYSESFEFNIAPVPIPATAWLMGSGLVGLAAAARRKS